MRVAVLPSFTRRSSQAASTRIGPTSLIGLAAVVFIPLLLLMAVISVIGIPLALALLLILELDAEADRARLALSCKGMRLCAVKLGRVKFFRVGAYFRAPAPFVATSSSSSSIRTIVPSWKAASSSRDGQTPAGVEPLGLFVPTTCRTSGGWPDFGCLIEPRWSGDFRGDRLCAVVTIATGVTQAC